MGFLAKKLCESMSKANLTAAKASSLSRRVAGASAKYLLHEDPRDICLSTEQSGHYDGVHENKTAWVKVHISFPGFSPCEGY